MSAAGSDSGDDGGDNGGGGGVARCRYRDAINKEGRLPSLKRGTKVWVGAEQVIAAVEAMVPRPKLLLDDAINRPHIVDHFVRLTTELIDSVSQPTIWPPKWGGPRMAEIQQYGQGGDFAATAQEGALRTLSTEQPRGRISLPVVL